MLLLAPEKLFSGTYQTARKRFLNSAKNAGAHMSRLAMHATHHDETLSTDIAWFGSPNPKRALVVSSGIHGVEGFAGSAVQLAAIEHLPELPGDTALIMLHILNPFGMSQLRRTNPANVDLNRNFHFDPKGFKQDNPHYAALNSLLNPAYPPRFDWFSLKLFRQKLRMGSKALSQVIAGGQHDFQRGLFFGGHQLEPEAQAYYNWLNTSTLKQAEKVFVLDIHTGLGAFGEQSLFLYSDKMSADTLSRRFKLAIMAEKNGARCLTYDHQGGSSALYRHLFSRQSLAFLTIEYGTYDPTHMLKALRTENQLYHYGRNRLNSRVKKHFKDAFCPYPDIWRKRVVIQGIDLVSKAVNALTVDE
ncbi:MAG: DUF2817 domain-containing protein [Deltaproteobacteria bacterium]|jgi:succinylglutamate desuccinylase|nr:DUF2817 domain-containing protein [Deltaproteobacteria bacterium]